jgi:hypothetical protein
LLKKIEIADVRSEMVIDQGYQIKSRFNWLWPTSHWSEAGLRPSTFRSDARLSCICAAKLTVPEDAAPLALLGILQQHWKWRARRKRGVLLYRRMQI